MVALLEYPGELLLAPGHHYFLLFFFGCVGSLCTSGGDSGGSPSAIVDCVFELLRRSFPTWKLEVLRRLEVLGCSFVASFVTNRVAAHAFVVASEVFCCVYPRSR